MPTNFLIGQIMMLFAYQEVKASKGSVFTVPFLCLAAYSLFIFVPVAGWFYYHYPAWSSVYIRPDEALPGWAGPGFFLTYFTGMVLGALLAQLLIQTNRTYLIFALIILGALWLLVTWAFTFDQYIYLGSYGEYHARLAKPVEEAPDFQMKLNIGGAIMAAPLIGLAYWFFKRSRRISRAWFKGTGYL